MPETATISTRGAPPPRIVVIDDHIDTRELVATMLSSGGFDVVAAPSGDAALAVIGDPRLLPLHDINDVRILNKPTGFREITPALLEMIPTTLVRVSVGKHSRGGAPGRAAVATSPPQSTSSSATR